MTRHDVEKILVKKRWTVLDQGGVGPTCWMVMF